VTEIPLRFIPVADLVPTIKSCVTEIPLRFCSLDPLCLGRCRHGSHALRQEGGRERPDILSRYADEVHAAPLVFTHMPGAGTRGHYLLRCVADTL
jgi:hypothetical protein